MFEKNLLCGKIKLIDLMKNNLKFESGVLKNIQDNDYFSVDFFDEKNEGEKFFSNCHSKITETIEEALPYRGIITKDGKIYNAIDDKHLITSIWLKLNGVDLDSSIRYFKVGQSIVYYCGYESFKIDGGKETQTINELVEDYKNIYESNNENQLFEVYKPQVIAMYNINKHFNKKLEDSLLCMDTFGLLKSPNSYKTERDRNLSKYNCMTFEENLPVDIKELRSSYKFEAKK